MSQEIGYALAGLATIVSGYALSYAIYIALDARKSAPNMEANLKDAQRKIEYATEQIRVACKDAIADNKAALELIKESRQICRETIAANKKDLAADRAVFDDLDKAFLNDIAKTKTIISETLAINRAALEDLARKG